MSKNLQKPVATDTEHVDSEYQKIQLEFLASKSAAERLGDDKIEQLGGKEGIARLFGYHDDGLEHSADA
jgi:hypothetical protein